MKTVCKILIACVLTLGCLGGLLCLGVSAEQAKPVPLSPALHVLAADTDMRVATLIGNDYEFSVADFARAVNLSNPEYITVKSLPDPEKGALYVGSDGVVTGQTLRASDISLMVFEPVGSSAGQSTFTFTVNGSPYEMTCVVCMLPSINASPTTATLPAGALSLAAYANTTAYGVLGGYDPEGDALTFEVVSYPQKGLLNVIDRATGAYTYTPGNDFIGQDSFVYVIRDCYGNYSASAKVEIGVQACTVSRNYDDLDGKACQSAALQMTEQGLMSGTQKGSLYCFEPDRQISRVDFLVTAMTAVGMTCESVADTGFADDAEIPSAMKGYVKTAYEKGYVSAAAKNGALYFGPGEIITRAEAAVILSNLIGYANQKIPASFTDTVPAFAEDAVVSLYSLGVLQTPTGAANATDPMTRGDAAEWLARTVRLIKGN